MCARVPAAGETSWVALALVIPELILAQNVSSTTLVFSARQLYDGFEARKVVWDKSGQSLHLDPRVLTAGKKREGRLTTDPIDLGPVDGIIGLPVEVKGVEIETVGEGLSNPAFVLEARSGANKVDQTGWSSWKELPGKKAELTSLTGRYLQVRMTLRGTAPHEGPIVKELIIRPRITPVPCPEWKPLRVVEADIQTIVRSPIVFQYERPDQPALVRFRREARLDDVVAGANDDFEKLVRLTDWVGSCQNVRGTKRETSPGWYAWDIEKVFSVENGTNRIYGHCMSYCEVLVSAATALGYVGARHWAIQGFRSMGHEVAEVWIPCLRRWVYLDPSLCHYYYDKETRVPLNLIEIHRIVVSTFVPEGKDVSWFCKRQNDQAKAIVKKIGGKTPIGCRVGPWHYGTPMPANYDWGWSHGYLAAGFVQMTPRNDFHSNPQNVSKRFGSYPGYDGYPNWVDEKTPPPRSAGNWYTRMRDFYWTLDQATVNLIRLPDGQAVEVQFGHSMPFFKHYQLTVDGQTVLPVPNPYRWQLKPGRNCLSVAPVDEFGKVGLASRITLEWIP